MLNALLQQKWACNTRANLYLCLSLYGAYCACKAATVLLVAVEVETLNLSD